MSLKVVRVHLPHLDRNKGLWSWYVKLTADHLCGAALAGGRDGEYVVVVRRDGVGG
jgi:hypothetical protein